MAGGPRLICASAALAERARGVRFEVDYCGTKAPAFVVRFEGRVRGFLNRCGHMPMELDWQEAQFFDSEGVNLICSTHGATYEAASGSCLGGPCGATPLVRLRVEERGGNVYYLGLENGG